MKMMRMKMMKRRKKTKTQMKITTMLALNRNKKKLETDLMNFSNNSEKISNWESLKTLETEPNYQN